jgi:hypothetical protein
MGRAETSGQRRRVEVAAIARSSQGPWRSGKVHPHRDHDGYVRRGLRRPLPPGQS